MCERLTCLFDAYVRVCVCVCVCVCERERERERERESIRREWVWAQACQYKVGLFCSLVGLFCLYIRPLLLGSAELRSTQRAQILGLCPRERALGLCSRERAPAVVGIYVSPPYFDFCVCACVLVCVCACVCVCVQVYVLCTYSNVCGTNYLWPLYQYEDRVDVTKPIWVYWTKRH